MKHAIGLSRRPILPINIEPASPRIFQNRDRMPPMSISFRIIQETIPSIDSILKLMVIVFDDFLADTAAIYRKVLAFINATDDGRQSFPTKMVSKSYRFSWLQRWLYRPPKPVMGILEASRKKQGKTDKGKASGVMGLRKRLIRFNVIKRKPAPLDGRVREILRETFASDTERLGTLIGRELSHWR